eukprot:EG_transcript_1785
MPRPQPAPPAQPVGRLGTLVACVTALLLLLVTGPQQPSVSLPVLPGPQVGHAVHGALPAAHPYAARTTRPSWEAQANAAGAEGGAGGDEGGEAAAGSIGWQPSVGWAAGLGAAAGALLWNGRRRRRLRWACPAGLRDAEPAPYRLRPVAANPLEQIFALNLIGKTEPKGFDYYTALLAAGFSFETYSEPKEARWERGSGGCDVAFVSDAFTSSIYRGLLEVRLLGCRDIDPEQDGTERLLSGGGSDVYTLWAVTEDEDDVKVLGAKHSLGVLDLQRAAHVARSSTIWAKNTKENGTYTERRGGRGDYEWNEEVIHLYVKDPGTAVLSITLMDDEVLKAHDVIGATSLKLGDVLDVAATTLNPLSFLGIGVEGAGASQWEGWLPIKTRPKQDKKGQITTGAVVGGVLLGPSGAMAGAALGAFFEPKARGEVHFSAKYLPLPPASSFPPPTGVRRVSVTEGVDWHELAIEAADYATTTADHELCCIVTHKETGCTALVYRDVGRKSVVVAFRGTCCLTDVVTDATLLQEPWIEGDAECKERVHAGFRASLQSVSRRLKELVVAAANGSLEGWSMLVTGHSLGGALATLFVADIAEFGVDAGRGLPTAAPSEQWWGRLWGKPQAAPPTPPRPRSLRLYTFGSPRVGNAEFAARFEATGVEAYRVVNGRDVVARVPRTVNAVISSIGYEHCGPTVLVSADPADCPLWVEGQSEGLCPVRDGTPLTNPFARGNLLGDVYEVTLAAFSGLTAEEEVALAAPVGRAPVPVAEKAPPSEDEWSDEGGITPLEAVERMKQATQGWRQALDDRLSRLNALEWATIVGLDHRYVQRELEIFASLQSGDALQHHLEPAYFKAMQNVLKSGAVGRRV